MFVVLKPTQANSIELSLVSSCSPLILEQG